MKTIDMRKTRKVPFAELRRFLLELSFKDKRAERAWVFRHPTEGLIVFRLYGEDEGVDPGDLWSTRRFLDLRGVIDGDDFDAFIQRATPA
jgi:hypothetical protein